MIDVEILIIPLLCVIGYLYFRNRRIEECLAKLPGPKPLPIVGSMFDFIVSTDELWKIVRQQSKVYYPIFKIYTCGLHIVNILNPDDLEVLLTNKENGQKSRFYKLLHPWLKSGLVTSSGSKWQERRKILTPAFHFNLLREFVAVFDEEGRRMVDEIKENKSERVHDLVPIMTKYTLNAICETAMGTSLSESTAFHSAYRRAVAGMGAFFVHRAIRPWLYPDFLFGCSPTGRRQKEALQIIHNFSKKIIHERQEYHDEASSGRSTSKKRLALLDVLIKSMKEGHIDNAGIQEEVDTFMFAGHDTSAMGMCFTLALLAEHADIQQRARDEIDAVLAQNGGKMDFAAIQQMTYLDRCIKESLRLYPPAHFIARSFPEDVHLKNCVIPKGVIFHIPIYDIHRDPNFWQDPESFDPDRFLPERIADRHPFAYIPFSAGQRNCIGQKFARLELKAMIGHLLRNFYLEPIDLLSKVTLSMNLILRPVQLRAKFVPR